MFAAVLETPLNYVDFFIYLLFLYKSLQSVSGQISELGELVLNTKNEWHYKTQVMICWL